MSLQMIIPHLAATKTNATAPANTPPNPSGPKQAEIKRAAMEFEAILESRLARESIQSAALACVAAVGVYIAATRDIGSRWTEDLTVEYLTQENPDMKPWLPEKNGIIYSADMGVFFRTFYKNPHADWKYILGFEPGVMLQEDLEILRKIQWNQFTPKAFERLRLFRKVLRKEFQSNEPTKLSVLSFVDDSHPAATELFDDAVMRDGLANHKSRRSLECHVTGAQDSSQRIGRQIDDVA